MQPPAMIALVPTATACAPSAIALAVSMPSLTPPMSTTGIPFASISLERVEALHDRRQRRDADILEHLVAGGARRALDAVEADVVEAVLVGDLDVVADAAGAELDRNRLLPPCRLAELLDLDDEIVGAEDVRVARRRAQVDPGGYAA